LIAFGVNGRQKNGLDQIFLFRQFLKQTKKRQPHGRQKQLSSFVNEKTLTRDLCVAPESFRVRFLAKPKQNGEDVEREKIRLETAERTCCQPDGLKATELVASNGLPRKLCLLTLCVCCCCTGGEEEGTGEMVGGGKEVNLGAGITLFLFLPFPSCVTATTTSHRLFFPFFILFFHEKMKRKHFDSINFSFSFKKNNNNLKIRKERKVPY
jgi:hypothetical protein